MKRVTKLFSISLIVIVVDQIVKLLVKFNMEKGDAGQIKILGDFFKLHFIENNGAAFGLTLTELFNNIGLDMSESTGKLILSLFSILAVSAIGVVLYRLKDHKSALPIFIALIFGGALGNIIDRTFYGIWFADINDYTGSLFYGRVVDMFYLDIWKGYLPDWKWFPLFNGQYTALWPIWNVADASISIGITVILLFQGRFFKQDELARGVNTDSSKPSELATDSKATNKPTHGEEDGSDAKSDVDDAKEEAEKTVKAAVAAHAISEDVDSEDHQEDVEGEGASEDVGDEGGDAG
ncbi:MAG: signal peptidase II [Bacteroidia bacterium]|nr:signal peptidase II [Bacteroidia bacterium]